MTTQTKAAVLRDAEGEFAIEDITLAELGPTQVLVTLVGAGFCHTDVVPRSLASYVLPAVLGHEGAGTVAAVGADVTRVAVGDPVVLTYASCGTCAQCKAGVPAYCTEFIALNMMGGVLDGTASATDAAGQPVANRWFGQSSFAEHCVIDQRDVVPVATDLPLELLGPLGCGIQTGAGTVLRGLDVQPGESIVVFGAGAVGLAAVMAAKIAGAGEVVAVDLHPSRLELATKYGATRVVDGADPELVAAIVAGGPGLDYAIDTTAVTSVMEAAIAATGPGGEVALLGASVDMITLHPTQLTGKKVTYMLEGEADPQEFIPYLVEQWQAGRFPFDELITTYPLADINRAEADSKAGTAIKPVLLP
ncbi:NAD(P)-dependent alcohol dehydrogenase [Nocardioides sp. YIM 152588]|uniref:NAD(P)-dependent alcohol dehydrogenase n=1 Tax=Nocardioides sp. YIM 152588 TaxID=3158259 RepID=UPI0032E51DDF